VGDTRHLRDGLFSGDGSHILISDVGEATLWDARSGAKLSELRDHDMWRLGKQGEHVSATGYCFQP
jgi:hypothetical protein